MFENNSYSVQLKIDNDVVVRECRLVQSAFFSPLENSFMAGENYIFECESKYYHQHPLSYPREIDAEDYQEYFIGSAFRKDVYESILESEKQ